MSDTDKRERGDRWYDAHRVTLALFVALAACFAWWGSLVDASTRAAEVKNVEQDGKLKAILDGAEEQKKFNERVDWKLDRLLERVK